MPSYRDRGLVLADPAQSPVPVAAMLDETYAEALRGRIRTAGSIRCRKAGFRGIPAPYTSLSLIVTATPAASSIRFMTISAPGSWRRKAACCFTIAVRASLSIRTIRTAWRQKRPLHTLIPGLVTKDGKVTLSYGVMGGEYQAFGHMQFLTRHLDYGMDVQMAQDTAIPRTRSRISSRSRHPSPPTRDALRALGHDIRPAGKPIGGSQAIAIDWQTGLLTAADPRKDGCAMGY